jgi:hypothetical protein
MTWDVPWPRRCRFQIQSLPVGNDLGSHFFSEPIYITNQDSTITNEERSNLRTFADTSAHDGRDGMEYSSSMLAAMFDFAVVARHDTTAPHPSLRRPGPRNKAREAFGIARDAMKRSTELNLTVEKSGMGI